MVASIRAMRCMSFSCVGMYMCNIVCGSRDVFWSLMICRYGLVSRGICSLVMLVGYAYLLCMNVSKPPFGGS